MQVLTHGWLNKLSRDPFYPWDMPTLRRNYGEPLQVIITEGVFSRKHHTVVHRTDEESSMKILNYASPLFSYIEDRALPWHLLFSGRLDEVPGGPIHRHGRHLSIHPKTDGGLSDRLVLICLLLHVAVQWRERHPSVRHPVLSCFFCSKNLAHLKANLF